MSEQASTELAGTSTMELVSMPGGGLYRAGRWSDVETFPEPAPPIPFTRPILDGYRWEDALGRFATAKCSATAEGAIGRTIARYRMREFEDGSGIINRIMEFMSGAPADGEPELREGRVPPDVFDDLYLIHIPDDSGLQFVDLAHRATLETLEELVAPALATMGMGALTENLAREKDRRLTRLIMTTLHRQSEAPVAGIRYPGQPDPEWEAYVLWAPPPLVDLAGENVGFRWVARWDEDLIAAADRLGVELP